MRVIVKVAGSFFVLLGTVWCLQGINVLPGSLVTGQFRWAEYGGIAAGVGISLLAAGRVGRSAVLREFIVFEIADRPSDNELLHKSDPGSLQRIMSSRSPGD
jgi:hypothetical protein